MEGQTGILEDRWRRLRGALSCLIAPKQSCDPVFQERRGHTWLCPLGTPCPAQLSAGVQWMIRMLVEGSGGEEIELPSQTDSFGLQCPENLKISALPQSFTELPHDITEL